MKGAKTIGARLWWEAMERALQPDGRMGYTLGLHVRGLGVEVSVRRCTDSHGDLTGGLVVRSRFVPELKHAGSYRDYVKTWRLPPGWCASEGPLQRLAGRIHLHMLREAGLAEARERLYLQVEKLPYDERLSLHTTSELETTFMDMTLADVDAWQEVLRKVPEHPGT